MASSSKGSIPPFYGYLDNLREEFDLLTDELIRTKKEKDELEATIESQIEELERMRQFNLHFQMRHGHCCQHCSTDPVTAAAAFSARTLPFLQNFPQPQSLEKSEPLGGIVSQQTTVLLRLDHIPSQSNSNPVSPPSLSTIASRLPSPSLSPSSPDSGSEECDLSIAFNHEVTRELDVEVVNVFFYEQAIECAKFSRDGKYLAAGCQDGKVYINNVATGTLTCSLRNLLKDDDCIRAVCFSPDGQYLAAGALSGYIYIWEINTKYLRKAFKEPMGLACTLDFSQSGRLLVSASEDNTVRLWSMRYGAIRVLTDDTHTPLDDGSSYSSALFSPDERYVAASHHDGMVRIWSTRTGQLVRRVRAHMGWANDIAFMPDGKGLMSGGNKTLKYLDISSSHVSGVETLPEREFSGHGDHVFSVDISPDGRWVASGSCDRSIRIWGIDNAVVQCILHDVEEVWTIEFSPAGGYLASSGFNGVVRLWKYSYITR